MKILCCGDLHVGRRSSRIPEDLDGRVFSCATAFESAVDTAVRRDVDLILFAGDIVDRANRFFEAFGPLERGLARLAESGIEACAVAGNHDFDVLPRLVETVGAERFHLIGVAGKWERRTLELRGGQVVHVDGWSFPREHYETDPLDDYSPSPATDAPVIGLLHGDTAASESLYAPVAVDRLQDQPVTAWVVGHVHKPAFHDHSGAAARVLVPGSVQALHRRESGPRGPWLLEIEGPGGPVRATQIPLSTVRYEVTTLDITGVESLPELESRIIDALREHREAALEDTDGTLRHLSCTLRLVGRTTLHRRVGGEVERALEEFDIERDGLSVRVDRVLAETRPAIDLGEIARANDPAGILAQHLLELERGEITPDGRRLVDAALAETEAIFRSKPYQSVGDDPMPAEVDVRSLLIEQGYRLLDELIAQKEPA